MGLTAATLSVLIMLLYQTANTYSMFWLTFWTEDTYLKNKSLSYSTEYNTRFAKYIVGFSLLGVLQGITTSTTATTTTTTLSVSQLAFYVNLHRAVIGPSATLTGR